MWPGQGVQIAAEQRAEHWLLLQVGKQDLDTQLQGRTGHGDEGTPPGVRHPQHHSTAEHAFIADGGDFDCLALAVVDENRGRHIEWKIHALNGARRRIEFFMRAQRHGFCPCHEGLAFLVREERQEPIRVCSLWHIDAS